ncbi:dihydrodipicolinate synthase family protein [Streptomyces paludis]|uniref:Dihydrodipicolinate synthase family protein n=1 Tax=Streptomyces paludis TaxID=2282738 RepID=A0A345HY01_9ACTN|nr:dihydrodipicolinate synthase family protein [Streptomyces paludis]AXG81575.1 dihydrodipicolinate synthase family protein [Streptomyces paludis]
MVTRDIITAVPVAFRDDGSLDLAGSRAILRHVAASGNEGAFVVGTTGEFPALSHSERGELVAASVEELSPHMRVVVHVGAASLFEVLALLDQARRAGATEVAVITPYYLPATDTALLDFYRRIAESATGLDVYVYVYRRRTGNFVTPSLMTKLAALPNIVGAKVSEEPLEQIAEYRSVVPSDFVLYTGADRQLGSAAGFGAQGVVSGVSSVLPKPFRALVAALASGDPAATAAAQAAVDDAVDAVAGDMGRMKAVYSLLGVPAGTTRMAMEPPSKEVLARLAQVVERYA